MGLTLSSAGVKVADEVFIATVLLHRENPGNADFSVGEIVERVAARQRGRNLKGGSAACCRVRVEAAVQRSLHCRVQPLKQFRCAMRRRLLL